VPKIGENSVGAGALDRGGPSVVIKTWPEARLKAIEIANALL